MVVPDRTRATLHAVIKKFIKKGTIIISDSWRAYPGLAEIEGYNYTHLMVNHSLHYVDPTTGAHTNTIEAKWRSLKCAIPRQAFREDKVLQEYLAEQMWRHSNKGHLWEAAIYALQRYVKRDFEAGRI